MYMCASVFVYVQLVMQSSVCTPATVVSMCDPICFDNSVSVWLAWVCIMFVYMLYK